MRGGLFIIAFLLAWCLSAQASVLLSGTVLDSDSGTPLSHALVYASPDTSQTFLAFTYTDQEGRFSLQVAEDRFPIQLQLRYLGYQEHKQRFTQAAAPLGELIFRLHPQENELQQVVVRQKRPPITQQADTLVYDLKEFTDSTEYNVEDILKKLPGISVGDNGEISVNGKAIQTVLIEDTDMFGRKYTVGTQNIRADNIARVEIINHYQDNPVLSSVNRSEDIVLNLRLKEDKKNILNGIADIGLGAGLDPSAKGLLNTNIFSVSKRHKNMLLSSNDNTGTASGIEEINATYDNFETKAFRNPIHQLPDFLQLSNLSNPGLPREFVDATTRLFSTIRSHHQIGQSWDLGVNTTFYHHRGQQQSGSNQAFFLNNNTYQLNIDRSLQVRQLAAEGDATLKYISPDKTRSLFSFLSIQHNKRDNTEALTEQTELESLAYNNQQSEKQQSIQLASLYSHQLSSSSVLQAQLRAASFRRPQAFEAENRDFPPIFGLDTAFNRLDQSLQWRHRAAELLGRYLWSNQSLLIELEPSYKQSRSQLDNTAAFLAADGSTPIDLFSLDFVRQGVGGGSSSWLTPQYGHVVQEQSFIQWSKAALNLHLRARLGGFAILHLSSELSHIRSRYQATEAPLQQPNTALRLRLQKDFTQERSGVLTYTYSQQEIAPAHLISTPYFMDAYSFFFPLLRTQPNSGQSLRLHYTVRNTYELRSWYVMATYRFGQQLWRSNQDFQQSLLLSHPFFTANDNQGLQLIGHWDQFVAAWKTNIRLQASGNIGRAAYGLQGETVRLNSQSYQVGAKISFTALYPFKFLIENRWSQQFTQNPDSPQLATNAIHTLRSAFTILYHRKEWQLSASWNASFSESNSGSRAHLQGYSARLKREFNFGDRPIIVGLRLVNFPNISEYSTWSTDAFFNFQSRTQAVPAFAILDVDFSF